MISTRNFEELHSHLINRLIVLAALASLIEVALLMTPIPRLDWLPYLLFKVAMIMGLGLLLWFRQRLRGVIKSVVFC